MPGACCSAKMDWNVHISACEITISVLEDSLSSLCDYGCPWRRSRMGSTDILTVYATMLIILYNTKHWQGHLLTLCWQLLWWGSLMTWQLHHSQRQLQLLFRCVWSSGRRVAWIYDIFNRLSETILWKIVQLLPVVCIHSWLLLWACCCWQFVNKVAWYTNFCNGSVLWLPYYACILCLKDRTHSPAKIPLRTYW